MTDLRRFRLVDTGLLVVVLAVAAGTRLWYVTAGADNGNSVGPLLVQDASPVLLYPEGTERHGRLRPTVRDALIHHLKADGSFRSLAPLAAKEERTAHTAPGFPVLLMLLEKVPADLGPPERNLRWLHVTLGTLTAGCYFLFGRRAFHSLLVATLAGLFCAVHPFWIVSTAEIEDGVVVSFLLAVTLALGARGGQIGGPLTSWLYGLGLASLGLVRAAYLPFAFVGVLWYLYRCQTLTRGWLPAFLAFLGFGTGLVPWTVRNLREFQDVFPIVDSVYLHLWIGNNPAATGGPLTEQTLREVLAKVPDLTLEELEESPQPARYRKLAWPVARELGNAPEAAVQRRLRAGLYFFFGEQWFRTGEMWGQPPAPAPADLALERGALPAWFTASYPALLPGSLLFMLCLGVLGWRWTAAWRREAMPSSLALVWIPLPYLLSHAETLCGPRLPLDGVLLTYAAFALACMLPGTGGVLLTGSVGYPEGEDRPRR